MNLLKTLHRLAPKPLESRHQILRQVAIAHEKRREPTFRDERMIER